MSHFSEPYIRDVLASDLTVLEPGLELLGVEVRLTNPIGSPGKIDILAKDCYGNRVIVEIKRSDQSARQAIHEIHKYVALFRSQHGLPTKRIRCFVVSTEWRELLVPFSEFVANSTYQIEGRQLVLDSSGKITKAEKIEPVDLSEGVSFFLAHSVLLYVKKSRREAQIAELSAKLKNTVVPGFIIIEIDRIDGDPRVIYPYALYIVFSRLDAETEAAFKNSYCDNYDYKWEDVEDVLFDDHCIAEILEPIDLSYDDFEIGNSEKLHTILENGWSVINVHRFGNVQSNIAASDDELISRLKGAEGENIAVFTRVTRPEFHLDWADIKKRARNSLLGNCAWTGGFESFCENVDKHYNKASVAIHIYNPLKLPITLFKYAFRQDARYVPSMELIATDESTNRILIYLGNILWDGNTHPKLLSALECFDEGLWGFLMANHFNEAWDQDEKVMEAHGLKYVIIQLTIENNIAKQTLLYQEDGELVEYPEPQCLLQLDRFCAENQEYLIELINEFNRMSRGL